jgi:hypothetical protein
MVPVSLFKTYKKVRKQNTATELNKPRVLLTSEDGVHALRPRVWEERGRWPPRPWLYKAMVSDLTGLSVFKHFSPPILFVFCYRGKQSKERNLRKVYGVDWAEIELLARLKG